MVISTINNSVNTCVNLLTILDINTECRKQKFSLVIHL